MWVCVGCMGVGLYVVCVAVLGVWVCVVACVGGCVAMCVGVCVWVCVCGCVCGCVWVCVVYGCRAVCRVCVAVWGVWV